MPSTVTDVVTSTASSPVVTSTSTATPTPTDASEGDSSSPKPPLFIIGLVVIILVLVGLLVWDIRRKRLRRANAAQEENELVSENAAQPDQTQTPEQYNYNEYGGYYADDVGREGGWSKPVEVSRVAEVTR